MSFFRKKYYLHKLHGYAENDLEFEDTSGQYTIANESLVSHNISNFVHGGFNYVFLGGLVCTCMYVRCINSTKLNHPHPKIIC